jgi:hypothetical protein
MVGFSGRKTYFAFAKAGGDTDSMEMLLLHENENKTLVDRIGPSLTPPAEPELAFLMHGQLSKLPAW